MDFVSVLADRTEMLAAALAEVILEVPIAHLHGGDTTKGAFDKAAEFVRKVGTTGQAENRKIGFVGQTPRQRPVNSRIGPTRSDAPNSANPGTGS